MAKFFLHSFMIIINKNAQTCMKNPPFTEMSLILMSGRHKYLSISSKDISSLKSFVVCFLVAISLTEHRSDIFRINKINGHKSLS